MRKTRSAYYTNLQRLILFCNQILFLGTYGFFGIFSVAPFFDQSKTLQYSLQYSLFGGLFLILMFALAYFLIVPYWLSLIFVIFLAERVRKIPHAYLYIALFFNLLPIICMFFFIRFCTPETHCFDSPIYVEGIGFYGVFFCIANLLCTFPLAYLVHRIFLTIKKETT